MYASRRDFVRQVGGAAAVVLAPALLLRSRATADLVVRGGTVFDGTGSPGVEADVAVVGGRVAAVAPRLGGRGTRELDARGLAVAPGFVDLHSHADGTLAADPAAESVVRQGITTVVVGQDGSSGATDGATLAAWRAGVDRLRPAVNVATMVGLGTVRARVVGLGDRPATARERARMAALVADALAAGACGASSGLEYPPGAFASADELAAVCAPLARHGLPYATHLRNEDDRLVEAVREGVAVASDAGCPLHLSHLKTEGPRNWGKLDTVFDVIASAAARGLDVTFDRYPYVAYATGLANLFPVAARHGGTAAFVARLAEPATAAGLRTAVLAKVALLGGWDAVMVTSVADPRDRAVEGVQLGAYAAGVGADPYDVAVALLRRSAGDVGMVGFAMSEDNLARILAHPRGMVASGGGAVALAGPARRGHPHPRALGTFPRVLGRYVRERRVLSLADAVRRMTSGPADRIGLGDRGRLARGTAADLVVFDPSTVADRATYADPYQYPAGIVAVVIGGTVAYADGRRNDSTREARTGRALRPGPRDVNGRRPRP